MKTPRILLLFSTPLLSIALLVTGATQVGAAVVAQYSFEGNLNDTAPSGGTADNMTATGAEAYAPGIVGQAGNITAGGMQRTRATSSADLNLGADWTVEAFVRPDSNNTGEWDRFWTKWGDGGNEWHFSFRSTGPVTVNNGLDLFINGGNNIINSNTTAEVPLDEWSHVALVGDQTAGTITAWLNGVQVGSVAWANITATGGAMNFGNFNTPANALQYSGLIDEALIHDEPVSEAYLLSRTALIPEPSTFALFGLGGLAILLRRRR